MKWIIRLGARVGAVMQNVCVNVDFEVVSLPGGSLIAVILWLYALRVRSGPRHSSAELPLAIRRAPQHQYLSGDRSSSDSSFPTRHIDSSAALTRQSVRLVRGHCPRSRNEQSDHGCSRISVRNPVTPPYVGDLIRPAARSASTVRLVLRRRCDVLERHRLHLPSLDDGGPEGAGSQHRSYRIQ
jgi:hypothetical protein